MENGPDPKRAEAAADRLATPLSPDAGHLVHMPAHIYYRLGRWKDSIRVNIEAARVDEAWIKAAGDNGLVRYGYYPHNVHFIVTSAQMAGDMATAIREASSCRVCSIRREVRRSAGSRRSNAAPFFATAQFARPEQILAMKTPDAGCPMPRRCAIMRGPSPMRSGATGGRSSASSRPCARSGRRQAQAR